MRTTLVRVLAALALAVVAPPGAARARDAAPAPAPAPGISVQSARVKAHSLARVKAVGVDPKAGILWRVTPAAHVSKATSGRGVLEFVAPPGAYDVELLVIAAQPDGALKIDEYHAAVEFEGAAPPAAPPAPKGGAGKLDPPGALAKISFPPYGCTATVIGPRRADGKWDVLTAAHCVAHVKVGSTGTMKLLDGRTFRVTVGYVDHTSDVSWMTTDDATAGDVPYARLAADNPPVGTAVWHAGYGVDAPGNREEGAITGAENRDGQLNMRLSVSSGDSGGGILRADTNEVVSVVCCTTAKGRTASVWGCSANKARACRPKSAGPADGTADRAFEWSPMEIPILPTLGP